MLLIAITSKKNLFSPHNIYIYIYIYIYIDIYIYIYRKSTRKLPIYILYNNLCFLVYIYIYVYAQFVIFMELS